MFSQRNVREGDEVTARNSSTGEWQSGTVDSTSEDGCQVVFEGECETTFVPWFNVQNVSR